MPFYLILAALVVVIDQVVKYLVRVNIPLGTSVEFLPGLDLAYVQNTGAAFSLLSAHTWVLTLLSGVVAVILLVALVKKSLPGKAWNLGLALLLGGAVGNFIDRFFFHFVTDMFATTFMNFAVFNVADIGVVIGGALFCLCLVLSARKDKKEEKT